MAACPVCKKMGLDVDRITVINHAKESCWPLSEEKYAFCENPECNIVYFTTSGRKALKITDVKTRVTFKGKKSPKPLCYCKQVTEDDIIKAIEKGALTFDEVKLRTGIGGGGQCKITNPSGRCCSRNYTPFIEKELEKKAQSP